MGEGKTEDGTEESSQRDAARVRAERDMLRLKLDALERSFVERRGTLTDDGKEVLRKA